MTRGNPSAGLRPGQPATGARAEASPSLRTPLKESRRPYRAGMASIALTGTATREALSHAGLVVDRLDELRHPQRIGALIESTAC